LHMPSQTHSTWPSTDREVEELEDGRMTSTLARQRRTKRRSGIELRYPDLAWSPSAGACRQVNFFSISAKNALDKRTKATSSIRRGSPGLNPGTDWSGGIFSPVLAEFGQPSSASTCTLPSL
jgi:hypothetical protein